MSLIAPPTVPSCRDNRTPSLQFLSVDSDVLGDSVVMVVDDVVVYGTKCYWGELCGAVNPSACAVDPLAAPFGVCGQKCAGTLWPSLSADSIQQSSVLIIGETPYVNSCLLWANSHRSQLFHRLYSCTLCQVGNFRGRLFRPYSLHTSRRRKPTMEPIRTSCYRTAAVSLRSRLQRLIAEN